MVIKKKTIIILVLLVFLVLTINLILIINSNITGKSITHESYKIGVILPMSGHFAFYGEKSLQGAKLAIENYDNIELIIEDDEGDPSRAASAAHKLINVDDVDAIITIRSSISSAIAPIAEKNKVVMLYPSTINAPAEGNSYVYKNFINIEKDCSELAKVLKNKKGALIGHNLDATHTCIKGFKDQGVNLQSEFFNKGDNDFRTSLLKIKENNPDFIVIRGDKKILPTILRQMKELDINQVQLVCPQSGLCNDKKTILEFEEYFENALGSSIYEGIEENGFEDPIDMTFAMYENIDILSKLLNDCKGNNECMIKELQTKKFQGLDGEIVFNDKGVSQRSTTLMKFENGEWEIY